MSKEVLAKLAEHSNVKMRDDIILDSAHGTLPSSCNKCKGFLDFVRIHNVDRSETVLKCRECGHVVHLD